MILEDITSGFQAKDQVIILQSQNQVCQQEKIQLSLINESYVRDGVSLQLIINTYIEEASIQKKINKNEIKIEKKKSNKWKVIVVIEAALIVLLIIAK